MIQIDGDVLYQWDTGRTITIYPYNGLKVSEVHFMNPDGEEAYKCEITQGNNVVYATIPNILLQKTDNIKVYVTMTTDTGSRTVKECTFGVNPRQKPMDYILPELLAITDANAFLKNITSGEYLEPTGLDYERITAIETSLSKAVEKLKEMWLGVPSPPECEALAEPFGIEDFSKTLDSLLHEYRVRYDFGVVNRTLDEVLVTHQIEDGLGKYTYSRCLLNAIWYLLNDIKEKLIEKGVEVPEPFGYDLVPEAIESIGTDGEYKELAETYKAEAEAEKQRADNAVTLAESESKRANEATARAETAEVQAETYRTQAEQATANAQAEKERADGLAETNEELQKSVGLAVDLIERDITEVTIPEGITSIGDNVFRGCKTLSKVNNLDDITSIGESAFDGCTELKEINLPEGLNSVGMYVIRNSGVTRLVVPSTVTTIENSVFRGIPKLVEVVVKKGVKGFSVYAFAENAQLKRIELPNSLTTMTQGSAFYGCKALEEVILEDGFNASSVNFSYSTLYSVETLVAMLEAIADLTGQTAKTLTIGSTNLAKLTLDQQDIAYSKNWTLV